MPAKRKSKTARKKGRSNALWFVAAFLILIVISVFLVYYFSRDEQPDKNTLETSQNKTATPQTESNLLTGTWVSSYDGAIMVFKGKSFTIEFPSVDNGTVISGTYSLSGETVTIIYNNSETCAGIPGKYSVKREKSKLIFKLISDSCKNRIERMKEDWSAI